MANQNNVLKNQLNRAQVVTRPGHTAIQTALKRTLVVADPPTWETGDRFSPETETKPSPGDREFAETDAVNIFPARAVFAVTALEATTDEVMKNVNLSAAGRVSALQEARTGTIKAIATNAVPVAAQRRERNARKEDFYAPTKLAPDNVVEALQDGRIIDNYNACPLSKRMRMIAQGLDGRTLEALMRSPIALEPNEAALVRDAWHAHVDKRDPAKSAALKTALANQAWAEGVIRTAAQFAIRYSGLTPSEIAEAAGSGAHLFNGSADHAA